MSDERPGEMRIGQVLEQARARAGLEIADVEEQTKIRAKYLRALEAEDWDELPSSAYAKGFLRTYASCSGSTPRRSSTSTGARSRASSPSPSYPLGDQVLERRRRPGGAGRRRSRTWLVARARASWSRPASRLAIVLTERRRAEARRQAAARRQASGRAAPRRRRRQATSRRAPVTLELRGPRAGRGLPARRRGRGADRRPGARRPATTRSFERKEFELRFPSGFAGDQLTVKIAGDKRLLPKADGPAAYEITPPQHVRTLKPPGTELPVSAEPSRDRRAVERARRDPGHRHRGDHGPDQRPQRALGLASGSPSSGSRSPTSSSSATAPTTSRPACGSWPTRAAR